MQRAIKKLIGRLYEALPSKSCVYFIYTHKNGFDRFRNGLKANTEISFWGYNALKENFPKVRFLRLENEDPKKIAKISEDDVVIGHVGETFKQATTRTHRLITFCPWAGHDDHSSDGFNCIPKDVEMGYFNKAASVILLTSEYNKKEYLEKPRNFWYPYFNNLLRSKRVRIVHQPIDLTLFKRIKWSYETDDFLYIGNKGSMKGVEEARKWVTQCERNFHVYGIDGVSLNNLDEKQVSELPLKADFFIQPGKWEAQCVSILEAAARGFICVVTPETGYPYEHPFMLRYGDENYNLKVLRDLLNTSKEERRKLADELHSRLVSDIEHNNWSRLTDVLVQEVSELFKKV